MQMVATCPLNSGFLGNFSRVTTGDSLSAPVVGFTEVPCAVKRSDSSLLPNMADLLKILTTDLICPLLLGLHWIPYCLRPSFLWKSLQYLDTQAL